MADTFTSPRHKRGNTHPVRPAEVHSTKAAAAEAWRAEMTGRCHWFPGQFDNFLDDLLPSSVPYEPMNNITDAFSSFQPVKGKEVLSYDGLVSTVCSLPLYPTKVVADRGTEPSGH